MATLHTPVSLPASPRPPSRPRMNSALTLITPEKAQALLATAYQGQRPLRLHHVRFLRHLLRTGHWRQGAEIHCARIGSERFLINGQHTLTALVQERSWPDGVCWQPASPPNRCALARLGSGARGRGESRPPFRCRLF